jgi:putative ABC transport system substrate-binding protein
MPNGGLFVAPDLTTALHRDLIISLAAKHRLPAVFAYGYFAARGGLIGYGVDIVDFYRRAPAYIDRIFKGTNPGTLPVQQPIKFELVINRKAAKALGLEIPSKLLFTADEVIE